MYILYYSIDDGTNIPVHVSESFESYTEALEWIDEARKNDCYYNFELVGMEG